MPSEESIVLVTAALPVVNQGSEGEPVLRLQALLNAAAGADLLEDGIFQSVTEAAVKEFQTSRHVPVDGVVGAQTWAALLSVPPLFPDVIVFQPQPFDLVDDPIVISGIGRAFEGTISTRALDAHGNTFALSFVQGGAVTLSTFKGELAFNTAPTTAQGTVEVGQAPVTDEGPPPQMVVIPVVFGRVLDDTYTGFHPRVTRPGETLSGLAEAFYGDASLSTRIFEANRNVIADPDRLVPGQILRIPFGAGTFYPPGG